MKLALDFPECFHSPLGRLDPRWKLAGLIPAAVVAALLQSPGPILMGFAAVMILVFLTRLPPVWYLARMGGLSLVLLLFLIWIPFLEKGEIRYFGPVPISLTGTLLAFLIWIKALTLVSLMLVLWTTAPLPETCKAAQALRIPGLLVQLTVMTYRYVFLLAEELGRIRIALRVRGFRNRPSWHGYRTVGQVTGTLLVRSHERAERVGHAMRCRGFDGRFRTLCDFRTRPRDVLAWLFIVAWAGGLMAWDFF